MNEKRIQERIEELKPKYPTLGLRIIEALVWYALDGRPTGGFLRAFLANDLMDAVGRADNMNQLLFNEIAKLVYNDIPGNCHGDYEIYVGWIAKHQERRKQEAKEESK